MRSLLASSAAASLFGPLAILALAATASAQELTGGCSLEARAFDSAGVQVGTAYLPGERQGDLVHGGRRNPFYADFHGTIDFVFRTGDTVFENNHWAIQVNGVPLLSGSDDNPLDTDESGSIAIASVVELPGTLVGVFHVTGDLWGNDDANHCHADAWVALVGDPMLSIPWDVAAGALAFGLLGLVLTPYSTTWETDPNAGEQLHSGPVPKRP